MDEFYIIWTTRNGQRMWDGPKFSFEEAYGLLHMNLNRRGGYILEITTKVSFDEEEEKRNAEEIHTGGLRLRR